MADDPPRTRLRAEAQLQRWRANLITLVLAAFGAGTVSGLILYFVEPFVGDLPGLGTLHWVLGIAIIAPYALYQWPHFLNNRDKSDHLHYKAGLWTFFSVVGMTVSGIGLIFVPFADELTNQLIDIAHLFTSFVFIMLLAGHLVLVSRITLRRTDEADLPEDEATRRIVRATIKIPALASVLLLAAAWLFF